MEFNKDLETPKTNQSYRTSWNEKKKLYQQNGSLRGQNIWYWRHNKGINLRAMTNLKTGNQQNLHDL